jgi:hypothetical protein
VGVGYNVVDEPFRVHLATQTPGSEENLSIVALKSINNRSNNVGGDRAPADRVD